MRPLLVRSGGRCRSCRARRQGHPDDPDRLPLPETQPPLAEPTLARRVHPTRDRGVLRELFPQPGAPPCVPRSSGSRRARAASPAITGFRRRRPIGPSPALRRAWAAVVEPGQDVGVEVDHSGPSLPTRLPFGMHAHDEPDPRLDLRGRGCAEILGAKWTALLVHDLSEGARRSPSSSTVPGHQPADALRAAARAREEGILVRRATPSPAARRVRADREGRGAAPGDRGDAPLRPRVARRGRATRSSEPDQTARQPDGASVGVGRRRGRAAPGAEELARRPRSPAGCTRRGAARSASGCCSPGGAKPREDRRDALVRERGHDRQRAAGAHEQRPRAERLLERLEAEPDRRASGGTRPAGAADDTARPRARRPRAPPRGAAARRRGAISRLLARREPDREVRLGRRPGAPSSAACGEPPTIPFTSTAGSASRAQVELLGRARVGRARALVGELLARRSAVGPARLLLRGRRDDPVAQRLGQPAVARRTPPRASASSACVAFSAAPPYMPECRSRAPVRTLEVEVRRARAWRCRTRARRARHAASKIIAASAPRSSAPASRRSTGRRSPPRRRRRSAR